MVVLMGLSVAKGPAGDLISGGGLDGMSLGGSRLHVCVAGGQVA